MRRGEVWWSAWEGKRRPVVVLTRDPAIPVLGWVTVVPTTTRIRGLPTEVRLGPSDGMPEDCAAAVDNVKTIRKSLLRRRIAVLPPQRLEQICEALAYALGC